MVPVVRDTARPRKQRRYRLGQLLAGLEPEDEIAWGHPREWEV